jgi:hypothetical protein
VRQSGRDRLLRELLSEFGVVFNHDYASSLMRRTNLLGIDTSAQSFPEQRWSVHEVPTAREAMSPAMTTTTAGQIRV